MATFPTAVKTFTDRATGDTITDAFFDEPNGEITAIQTFLRSSLFSAVNSAALPVASAYTPTWGANVSNPTLGNGSLAGAYLKIGKLVVVSIQLTFGSTTTAGSGVYTFTLPGTAASAGSFWGLALDSGGARNYTTVGYFSDSTHIAGYAEGGNFVGNTQPFTWANGDSWQLTGIYFEA